MKKEELRKKVVHYCDYCKIEILGNLYSITKNNETLHFCCNSDCLESYKKENIKPKPEGDVQLLPCPFCGSKAELNRVEGTGDFDSNSEYYNIRCTNEECHLSGADWDSAKGKISKIWNERAGSQVHWISVNEQLPEKDTLILAYYPEGNERDEKIDTTIYYGGKLTDTGSSIAYNFIATHWAKLIGPNKVA